ncbi:MAG: hypothetical protein ACM3WV_07710 [Bacillota bacterium]
MTNGRGNKIEIMLLADHYSVTDSGGDNWSNQCAFTFYPSWASAQKLGYNDLRTAWGSYITTFIGPLSTMSNRSQLLTDGVHLNDRGQKLWAKIVLRYFNVDYPTP